MYSVYLIIVLGMLSAFGPFVIDMYLPAMPEMTKVFSASVSSVQLGLTFCMVGLAFGQVIFGPLSDKYGRKKVLIVGTILYVAASAVCAASAHVYMMIAARIVQGIGAGAITAVSMALIKDCFQGKQRETILAIVQSVAGLAPMIAPVLGAVLLQFTDWRGSFVVLTAVGAVCLLLAFLYQETLSDEERYEGTVLGSLGRLVTVGKNMGFLVPCLIFSLYNLAFMGYIAMSSYIYVEYFGLSEQVYSYFFAANAALSMVGPILYVRFMTGFNKKKFAMICFALYAVCGAAIVLIGHASPFLFWIGFAPFSLIGTITRPFGTNIMLDQQSGDTGSASSLINGVATILGSVGMMCASMWADIVFGLGFMICVTGIVSVICWMLLMRSAVPCRGVK